jgi:hypothetical protein
MGNNVVVYSITTHGYYGVNKNDEINEDQLYALTIPDNTTLYILEAAKFGNVNLVQPDNPDLPPIKYGTSREGYPFKDDQSDLFTNIVNAPLDSMLRTYFQNTAYVTPELISLASRGDTAELISTLNMMGDAFRTSVKKLM